MCILVWMYAISCIMFNNKSSTGKHSPKIILDWKTPHGVYEQCKDDKGPCKLLTRKHSQYKLRWILSESISVCHATKDYLHSVTGYLQSPFNLLL